MSGSGTAYRFCAVLLVAIVLGACAGPRGGPAPVVYGARGGASGPGGAHTVEKGDTLYTIARHYGIELRPLIDVNGIAPPYTIYPGQKLRLPGGNRAPDNARGGDDGKGGYVVARGDTVYRIAETHGIEPGALVRANRLEPPFLLRLGQRLAIPGRPQPSSDVRTTAVADRGAPTPRTKPGSTARTVDTASVSAVEPSAAPAEPSEPATRRIVRRPPASAPNVPPPPLSRKGFIWPLSGKLLMRFGDIGKGLKNDGLNIAASRGAPVRAIENGVVAYAGNELRGFGNLLLLKHDNGWISAYAHNDTILVGAGDRVVRGQVVSHVGSTGSVDEPQLHFELRRGNRAVDPERYLGRRTAVNMAENGRR